MIFSVLRESYMLQESSPDILRSISDTLNCIGPKVQQIADATDPVVSQWNLIVAVIAAATGVLSAVFGFLSYKYSRKTADNVLRTDSENRLKISGMLIETVYRRMVYIRACLIDKSIISYKLLRSLHLPDFNDCFILEDYRNDGDRYRYLLCLKHQMCQYGVTVNDWIDMFRSGKYVSDDDCQDLMELSVKVLIELYHVNRLDSSSPYADILLHTIAEFHFSHLQEMGGDVSGIPYCEGTEGDDRGMRMLDKLIYAGTLDTVLPYLRYRSRNGLPDLFRSVFSASDSCGYMEAVKKIAESGTEDRKVVSEWFYNAWIADASIIRQQFIGRN